jgi:hypothetical protein
VSDTGGVVSVDGQPSNSPCVLPLTMECFAQLLWDLLTLITPAHAVLCCAI